MDGIGKCCPQLLGDIMGFFNLLSGNLSALGRRIKKIVPNIVGLLRGSTGDSALTVAGLTTGVQTATNTANSTINQKIISQVIAANTLQDPGTPVGYNYYQYVPPFFPPYFGPFFPPVFGPFFPPPFPWANGKEEQPY
jgi:hypothetical protein